MVSVNLRGMLRTVQVFAPDIPAAGERDERAGIVLLSAGPARKRLNRPVHAVRDHIEGPVDAPLTLVEHGRMGGIDDADKAEVLRQVRDHFGQELRDDEVRARTIATGYVRTPLTERRTLPDVTEHTALAPLRAEDVSAVVLHTLSLPKDVNVHDMVVVPTYQGRARPPAPHATHRPPRDRDIVHTEIGT